MATPSKAIQQDLSYTTAAATTAVAAGTTVAAKATSDFKESVEKTSTLLLKGHKKNVTCVCWDQKSQKLVSASADGSIRVWDINKETSIEINSGHTDRVSCLALNRDGTFLASGGQFNKKICIHNMIDNTLIKTLEAHESVLCLCFHPEKPILAVGGSDKSIQLWNIDNFQLISKLEGHSGSILSLDFSSDGNFLVSGSSDKTVRLWNFTEMNTNKVSTANHPNAASIASKVLGGRSTASVEKVAFSPIENVVAYGGGGNQVHIYDIEKNEIKTLDGPKHRVRTIVFSQNGKNIFSAGQDCTIHAWNMISGQLLLTLSGFNTSISSICLIEKGNELKLVATSGENIKVLVPNLNPGTDPELVNRVLKLEQANEQLKKMEEYKLQLEKSSKTEAIDLNEQLKAQALAFANVLKIQPDKSNPKVITEALEQTVKIFEQRLDQKKLFDLENDLSSMKNRNEEIENKILELEKLGKFAPDLKQRADRLSVALRPLREEYEKQQEILQMQTFILHSPQLGAFYRRLQVKLNQLFTAYFAISSGQISRTDDATAVLQILDKPISALTLGFGSIILGGVATALNRQAIKQMSAITEEYLISLTQSEKLVEETARLLTLRYEDQIRKLTPPGEESLLATLTISRRANGGAEILADCAVARIIDGLKNRSISFGKDMVNQLVDSVFTSARHQHKILDFFTSHKVPTSQSNNDWTDIDLFRCPGIKIRNGNIIEHFIGNTHFCNSPAKYLYRFGTLEEVKALGLKKQHITLPLAKSSIATYSLSKTSKLSVASTSPRHNETDLIKRLISLEDELRIMKVQIEEQQKQLDEQRKLIENYRPSRESSIVATTAATGSKPSRAFTAKNSASARWAASMNLVGEATEAPPSPKAFL